MAIVLFGSTMTNAHAEYVGNDINVQVDWNKTTTIQMTGSAPQAFFYIVETAPSHGTLEYNGATGEAFYTPFANYTGPDSFTFTTAAVMHPTWFGDKIGVVSINVVDPPAATTTNNSAIGGPGNRMYEFAWDIAHTMKDKMNNQIPDSAMHLYQINVMNGELYSAMMGADFAGIGWNNLSEGQQVFILIHWEELVAGQVPS